MLDVEKGYIYFYLMLGKEVLFTSLFSFLLFPFFTNFFTYN